MVKETDKQTTHPQDPFAMHAVLNAKLIDQVALREVQQLGAVALQLLEARLETQQQHDHN